MLPVVYPAWGHLGSCHLVEHARSQMRRRKSHCGAVVIIGGGAGQSFDVNCALTKATPGVLAAYPRAQPSSVGSHLPVSVAPQEVTGM
jgi:hypothetical protein